MRILVAVLIALLLISNYLLWISEDRGMRQVRALNAAVQTQRAENAALSERNKALEAEVKSLKKGVDAIEERARVELGMIRKGETFFRILEKAPVPDSVPPASQISPARP